MHIIIMIIILCSEKEKYQSEPTMLMSLFKLSARTMSVGDATLAMSQISASLINHTQLTTAACRLPLFHKGSHAYN